MRRLLETLVFDTSRITDELVQARFDASMDPETVALNRDGHWPRQSLDRDLTRVTRPTLIVWGQDCRTSPIDAALQMLRLIPDAQLHVFNRCGHWVQVKHAAEFNRIVLDFFAA